MTDWFDNFDDELADYIQEVANQDEVANHDKVANKLRSDEDTSFENQYRKTRQFHPYRRYDARHYVQPDVHRQSSHRQYERYDRQMHHRRSSHRQYDNEHGPGYIRQTHQNERYCSQLAQREPYGHINQHDDRRPDMRLRPAGKCKFGWNCRDRDQLLCSFYHLKDGQSIDNIQTDYCYCLDKECNRPHPDRKKVRCYRCKQIGHTERFCKN